MGGCAAAGRRHCRRLCRSSRRRHARHTARCITHGPRGRAAEAPPARGRRARGASTDAPWTPCLSWDGKKPCARDGNRRASCRLACPLWGRRGRLRGRGRGPPAAASPCAQNSGWTPAALAAVAAPCRRFRARCGFVGRNKKVAAGLPLGRTGCRHHCLSRGGLYYCSRLWLHGGDGARRAGAEELRRVRPRALYAVRLCLQFVRVRQGNGVARGTAASTSSSGDQPAGQTASRPRTPRRSPHTLGANRARALSRGGRVTPP